MCGESTSITFHVRIEFFSVSGADDVVDYEEQNPLSVVLLCAHLYYRALQTVPTLVRLWILECKDRRLSAAVTTYTSKYFSSVLIDTELERVTSSRLGDEKMDVKVISVHREVNTTYTVDENEIKMSLKIPSDWPLHVIEVRGVKKIGVKEDRWMSWISGVRQVVLTQVRLAAETCQPFIPHAPCRVALWMVSNYSKRTFPPTLQTKPNVPFATRKGRFCYSTSGILNSHLQAY